MFKRLVGFATLLLISLNSIAFADCTQSFEFGVGWRRDDLRWRANRLHESSVDAQVASHIHFEDINMYTAHAKGRWADSEYYVRLSAEYGLSDKGRAEEVFKIKSSLFDELSTGSDILRTSVSSPIKRRSEFYDFTGAVGYPFLVAGDCLMIVPLVGASFHRQRIRVKDDEESSFDSYFSFSSENVFFPTSDPILSSSSDEGDPFSSSSASNVASLFGISPERRTSVYRFTWWGPFAGVDIAWALDPCWTLFGEFEGHFLDRCHQKRKSHTAVSFVDHFHGKRWSYGFNGCVGTAFCMGDCWYATLVIDFKFMKSDQHYDELLWKSAGVNINLGCVF